MNDKCAAGTGRFLAGAADVLGMTLEEIGAGDIVQLEGQVATAMVVSINYGTNTLELDTSLTWSAGQNITLAFTGAGPDLGAYEVGLAGGGP